jgi:predicted Zn-dependent protease
MKLSEKSLSIALSILITISAVLPKPIVASPPTNQKTEREKPEVPSPDTNEENTDSTTKLTPEELATQQKFIEADKLYLAGDKAAAAKIYRELKKPFAAELEQKLEQIPKPFYDPTQLPPKGAVYWRISGQGLEQHLEDKTLVPLEFLVKEYPEFIPGHLRYAQALKEYGKPDEALKVLEKAATQYSSEPDLVKVTIERYQERKKWLEASMMARQFALINTEHPQAAEFSQLADENMKRYQRSLRATLRENAIGGLITGALGYVLTGSLFGPLSGLESTILLLQGESSVGKAISKNIQKQAPLLTDEEVLAYVREVGNKIAATAGRNFEYEFYVIMDDKLNAFALPGGKVFIHAGALTKTHSEAEFAGLLAHEISHAVLSHGFQLITEGNLTANITQFIPFVGGTAGNLIVLNYSRDMEKEADILGTKILVVSDYAADGLLDLMVTLDEEAQKRPGVPSWLSTHPNTQKRIEYLEEFIVSNQYDRYAYEGVVNHLPIQKKVAKLMEEYKKSDDYRIRRQNRNNDEG